jgi:hypothetical protein
VVRTYPSAIAIAAVASKQNIEANSLFNRQTFFICLILPQGQKRVDEWAVKAIFKPALAE